MRDFSGGLPLNVLVTCWHGSERVSVCAWHYLTTLACVRRCGRGGRAGGRNLVERADRMVSRLLAVFCVACVVAVPVVAGQQAIVFIGGRGVYCVLIESFEAQAATFCHLERVLCVRRADQICLWQVAALLWWLLRGFLDTVHARGGYGALVDTLI